MSQITQDETSLPPDAKAVAAAYAAIEGAAELGASICMGQDVAGPLGAACLRAQGQLTVIVEEVHSVEVMVDSGNAAPTEAQTLAEANAALNALVAGLKQLQASQGVKK